MVAQSVPDFSSALKKESRRPPPVNGMMDKVATRLRRSMNSRERKTGVAAKKSYTCIEELKGLLAAASLSIAGENRGGSGDSQRVVGKNPKSLIAFGDELGRQNPNFPFGMFEIAQNRRPVVAVARSCEGSAFLLRWLSTLQTMNSESKKGWLTESIKDTMSD
ncbi:hypothetical protein V2J09_001434 [Rumex salicifolius]